MLAVGRECLFRFHSSSSAENLETLSPDEITGPVVPSLEGSAKRLFLVRHGEVINPGERRQGFEYKFEALHLVHT